jgi:hypothetical protein
MVRIICFNESDRDFLFIRTSNRRVYMKFSSQFPQQLLIADAWNLIKLFLFACHIVRLIYCTNRIPTSCLSTHPTVECIWNFRHSFLSSYSLQMLEILTHSSFWHTILWDSFLCKSDADFLFISASVHRMYIRFSSQFPLQLLIADAWNLNTLFLLTCHNYGGIHFCVNQMPISCLSARLSLECTWNFRQFLQQLLTAVAWNFNTLFLLACNMMGFIFVRIGCRFPFYQCVCP